VGPRQDREGRALLAPAARAARPGPYQLHAAIAACHSCATETDWRQVAALYGELARYEPTAVVEANRAVAVAMAEGLAAGLAILDPLEPRLAMPATRPPARPPATGSTANGTSSRCRDRAAEWACCRVNRMNVSSLRGYNPANY
jgi:hypothetical protein